MLHWLRLLTTPTVGRVTARLLLREFGMPADVFAQTSAVLSSFVSAPQAQALSAIPKGLETLHAKTLDWLEEDPLQRAAIPLGHPLYPSSLLGIADPPLLLFVQGQIQALPTAWDLCSSRGIAVVGSRNPTPQGSATARAFSQSLAEHGCCIVSGLALGIDGAAHEGALFAYTPSIATIAVVGTGLDRVYPKAHHNLAHRIAEHGLLISEFPLGTPPHSSNFPLRNRIIAGLTKSTLVVEAAVQSGSLITAQLALEQGKDVLAIPGSIHSPQSKGCHWLIKQGAKLVETAQDVLEELAEQSVSMGSTICTPSNDAPPFLVHLGFEPSSIDELVARSGMNASHVQAALTEMELDGLVERLPGGMYLRSGKN
nr:DNA-processing protein DprA [Curvibacter sp. CHRR-16]